MDSTILSQDKYSNDELNNFYKHKLIQTNIKSNTITLSEQFTIEHYDFRTNNLENPRKTSTLGRSNTHYIPSIPIRGVFDLNELKTTFHNFELIKNAEFVALEKERLEKAFTEAFDNKNILEECFIIDRGMVKNLQKNLNFLKYDKLLSNNKAIMNDKNLVNKFKEFRIPINLPTIFNQVNENNSNNLYLNLFVKLFKKLESLKKELDNVPKTTTTNITINNTVSGNNNTNNPIENSNSNTNIPIQTSSHTLPTDYNKNIKVLSNLTQQLVYFNENPVLKANTNNNNDNISESRDSSLFQNNDSASKHSLMDCISCSQNNSKQIVYQTGNHEKECKLGLPNELITKENIKTKNSKNNSTSFFIKNSNLNTRIKNKSISLAKEPNQGGEIEDLFKDQITSLENQINSIKQEEEKRRKIFEQSISERFSREIFELKLKLEEKENLLQLKQNKQDFLSYNIASLNFNKNINDSSSNYLNTNSNKNLSNELKLDMLNKLKFISNQLKDFNYLVDKRLVTNILTKIYHKGISSKLKLELLDKLAVLLEMDNVSRKILGLPDNFSFLETNNDKRKSAFNLEGKESDIQVKRTYSINSNKKPAEVASTSRFSLFKKNVDLISLNSVNLNSFIERERDNDKYKIEQEKESLNKSVASVLREMINTIEFSLK